MTQPLPIGNEEEAEAILCPRYRSSRLTASLKECCFGSSGWPLSLSNVADELRRFD